MANHRWWKFRSPDTYVAGEYLGITEMEMRLTAGGADQTTGKAITASATASGGYVAARAIDDNLTLFWTTGATAPPSGGHWLKVDFGAGTPVDIVEMSLMVRPDTFREDPYEIVLEYSDDDITYTEVMHTYSTPAWTAGETRFFNRDTVHPPKVTITKAGLSVASNRNPDTLKVTKATLHVVRKEPTYVTITKASLQVARKEPTYITITKASLQIISRTPPPVIGDRRMSLM